MCTLNSITRADIGMRLGPLLVRNAPVFYKFYLSLSDDRRHLRVAITASRGTQSLLDCGARRDAAYGDRGTQVHIEACVDFHAGERPYDCAAFKIALRLSVRAPYTFSQPICFMFLFISVICCLWFRVRQIFLRQPEHDAVRPAIISR